MTARMWTREELDRVHPLAAPWAWDHDDAVGWYARGPRSHTVCVDARGDVVSLFHGSEHFDPPIDVVIAVGLASKGLDSLGAMAASVEVDAKEVRRKAIDHPHCSPQEIAVYCDFIAAMLRRGTVAS